MPATRNGCEWECVKLVRCGSFDGSRRWLELKDVLEYIFTVFYRSKAMLCCEQPGPDDDKKDGGGQDEALEQVAQP